MTKLELVEALEVFDDASTIKISVDLHEEDVEDIVVNDDDDIVITN